MSADTFPLSPLTADGVEREREDAWDELAAWAKTLAGNLDDPDLTAFMHTQIVRETARHDVALRATMAGR